MYKKLGKRTLDIILSAAGLLVLAIPMLIIAAIIKLDTSDPVMSVIGPRPAL